MLPRLLPQGGRRINQLDKNMGSNKQVKSNIEPVAYFYEKGIVGRGSEQILKVIS